MYFDERTCVTECVHQCPLTQMAPYTGFHIEREGGGLNWDFHPPGKVSPLQVLKKYYTAS